MSAFDKPLKLPARSERAGRTIAEPEALVPDVRGVKGSNRSGLNNDMLRSEPCVMPLPYGDIGRFNMLGETTCIE